MRRFVRARLAHQQGQLTDYATLSLLQPCSPIQHDALQRLLAERDKTNTAA